MGSETAAGIFESPQQAMAAVDILRAHGFDADQVSVLMNDPAAIRDEAHEGIGTGTAMGGILGGIGGLVLGAGLLMIPGLGPILAAGPIMAALGGAALGAGAGTVAVALMNKGLTEAEAQHLADRVRDGGVLVTVDTTSQHEEARALLRAAGATETDFSLVGDEPAAAGLTPATTVVPGKEAVLSPGNDLPASEALHS